MSSSNFQICVKSLQEFEEETERLREELKEMRVSKEQAEEEMKKVKTVYENGIAQVEIHAGETLLFKFMQSHTNCAFRRFYITI